MLFTTTSESIYIIQAFFPFFPRKLNAFWTDIIRSRSPQVLQVLLHYEYHWQLVQVFCQHKWCYLCLRMLFGSIKSYNECFPSNTRQSYQALQGMTSFHRISTNPFMRDSLTSIFAEQYIKFLLENTSTTLLVERYESCFLFTFIIIILMENASFSLSFLETETSANSKQQQGSFNFKDHARSVKIILHE